MTGSEPYVAEMEALSAMFGFSPMESAMAQLVISVDPDGEAGVSVSLRAERLAEIAAALIEWTRSLVRPLGVVMRSDDGATAVLGVIGGASENDTTIAVASGGVPYEQIAAGVEVAPGEEAAFDTDQLQFWAIDLDEWGGGGV